MDISQFVSDTLLGILRGVQEAQKDKDVGSKIGPTFRFSMKHESEIKGLIIHGDDNHTVVEFDIAVTTETSGDAKGQVKVLGMASADLNAEHSRGSNSRIKFSVPILLPQIEST